jgi:hypothetical protein
MGELASYIQAIHDVYPALSIEVAHLNRQGQWNDQEAFESGIASYR